MGAWGYASDENDLVWDEAGLGIMERQGGFGPMDLLNHEEAVGSIREDNPNGMSAGLVVFLLKLGCGCDKEELQKGLDELQEELKNSDTSPFGREGAKVERHAKIRAEIKMVTIRP